MMPGATLLHFLYFFKLKETQVYMQVNGNNPDNEVKLQDIYGQKLRKQLFLNDTSSRRHRNSESLQVEPLKSSGYCHWQLKTKDEDEDEESDTMQ